MRFKLYFDSRKCTVRFSKTRKKEKNSITPILLLVHNPNTTTTANLCGSDGLSSQASLLAGVESEGLLLLGLLSLLDDLILLGDDDLDVGWVGHVWVDLENRSALRPLAIVSVRDSTYTTVSTVCASSLLWCLVDLDVGDNEGGGVETLNVGVGDSVLEETEEELGGLLWPASLGGTELLSCFQPSVLQNPISAYFRDMHNSSNHQP